MISMQNNLELWKMFLKLGQEALYMSHYELAEHTTQKQPKTWRDFLNTTEVKEYIEAEITILRTAELNKMLKNISSSNSVGQAQLISIISKLLDQTNQNTRPGNTFVYCYIPLNEQQKRAENIQLLEDDPFL